MASRFHFHRKSLAKAEQFYTMMQTMEPESIPNDLTLEDWKNKTFEECVLSRDTECVFKIGSIRDSSVAYFCGQDTRCLEFGTGFALSRAKDHIDRFYPVVGILERLEESIKLSEMILPDFFGEASLIFDSMKCWFLLCFLNFFL